MEEKDISYQLIELDHQKGENYNTEFLAINPFGKLPTLIDSSISMPNREPLTLFESGAILLHLAEQYSEDIQTIEHKALTSQWLQFANSTLSIALLVPRHREKEFPRLMKELDRQLETGQPLVGNIWGAADCAIQAYLAYLPLMFPQIDLTPYPSIRTTIKHVERRPAYRKALGNLR
jgi:glutathione S-transferase